MKELDLVIQNQRQRKKRLDQLMQTYISYEMVNFLPLLSIFCV